MAKLTIRSASDLVKFFDEEPPLNPPAPRAPYDEDEDRKHLALSTSFRQRLADERTAGSEDLDPETLEPLSVDELIVRQEATSADCWGRTYGRDATDFGNYIDFLRSY
jgi:hypothetical protein